MGIRLRTVERACLDEDASIVTEPSRVRDTFTHEISIVSRCHKVTQALSVGNRASRSCFQRAHLASCRIIMVSSLHLLFTALLTGIGSSSTQKLSCHGEAL